MKEWNDCFHQLELFKREQGHCNVPLKWTGNPALASWFGIQRNNVESLSLGQLTRLYRLGFDFGWPQNRWVQQFFALAAYKKAKGDCLVPQAWPRNPILGKWASKQRATRPQLSLARVRWLNALGFVWSPLRHKQENLFEDLRAFKKRYGHCRVRQVWPANRFLAAWVHRLRVMPDSYPKKLRDRLDKIGFDWNPIETAWEKNFARAVEFHKKNGHCNVPRESAGQPALSLWIGHQRVRKNSLRPSQRKRLEALGIDWDPVRTQWERRYQQLKAFKQQHGHCNVSDHWQNPKNLGAWVYCQRRLRQRLAPELRKSLDDLGFEWKSMRTSAWEKHLEELKAFKAQYGHCNISDRWPKNRSLARWVSKQRYGGRLSLEQFKILDDMGLVWIARESLWKTRLQKLRDFKKKHGHCNVPQRPPGDPDLRKWVVSLRAKQHKLSRERHRQLDALGFDWNILESRWKGRFQELRAFKKRFGHCNVPHFWTENRQLSFWVASQRRARARLASERVKQLNRLEFHWRLRKWSRRK